MDKSEGELKVEAVKYKPEKKKKQIDMNPPVGQEVEPLTGSSVLIEPKNEPSVPDNGFPAGYGPNEHLKRIEKPKKPSFRERMKRTIKKLTKKQKIVIGITTGVLTIATIGAVVFVMVSGVFEVDYSDTYTAAKELRTEMQKLKGNASCDKVLDYVDNAYTTMQVYQSYIESCKEVGAGVTNDIVLALGDTEGVRRDEVILRKYNTFKLALDSAKEGNKGVDDLLDTYVAWHAWITAENTGDNAHAEWNWSEEDIEKATDTLLKLDDEIFVTYAKDWKKYKTEAAEATRKCLYPDDPAEGCPVEAKETMNEKQKAFTAWKKESEPNITKIYPLSMVDTAVIYNKFTELYDLIRETYQEHYNPVAGGCKEMVGQVICD